MLLQLINYPYFWNLISVITGVILGFLLGEGGRYIHYCLRIHKLKKIIKDELRAIIAQIPKKKDIVNQIIAALEKRQTLSGLSVRIINTGYNQHIAELYEHLPILKRNCLHVIHESLNIADKTLYSFERDFISIGKIIDYPFMTYKGRFLDILHTYDKVEKLIKEYLEGKPSDVFYIKNKK